jgi:hypothetical protein
MTPNQYDLLGTGITISYSTSSFAGKPQLSLKKGRQTLDFSGNDISKLDTGIGDLISVTIANVPDQSSTTFSFLLPAIQLGAASSKQAFRTIGITTVHKTSIAGPVKGVQETYKAIELKGTARQVEFLVQSSAGG